MSGKDGQAALRAAAAASAALAAALLILRKARRAREEADGLPVDHPELLGGYKMVKEIAALRGDFGAYLVGKAKELGSDVFVVNMFPIRYRSLVVAMGAEAAHSLYASENKLNLHAATSEGLKRLTGKHLQWMQGAPHKLWRRTVLAAFQPKALESYLPKITAGLNDMWAGLSNTSREEPVVMRTAIRSTLLRMSADFFYGMELGKGTKELQQLDADFALHEAGFFKPAINLPGFPFRKSWLATQRIRAQVRALLRGAQARRALGEAAGPSRLRSAIDAIMELQDDADPEVREALVNDDIVLDNMVALLNASQGTTNFTSTSLLGLLHRDCNRACLQRLREEVAASVASDTPTAEELGRMTYADGCINEAMRLYALVGGTAKELARGQEVELRGKVVRGPCMIQVKWDHEFLDPDLFPRPRDFLPERWLQDAPADLRVGSEAMNVWLPFGLGVHQCLGQKLAKMIVKVLLVTYVRGGYRLELAGPVDRVFVAPFPQYIVPNGLVAHVFGPDGVEVEGLLGA